MPSITRIGDSCTGHGCYPPRASTSGSTDVFVNGIGVHRNSDSWASHCCIVPCHTGTLSGGSATVFVNSKAVGRIGDSVSCGSSSAAGSANVFAGG